MRKLPVSLFLLCLTSVLIPIHIFADVSVSETTSVTVPARATDFSAVLTSDQTATAIAPNTTITYTLTYGSTLSTTTSITVQAEWSRGTVAGESSPSVNVLDYVSGSATNAYNSTAPVIDTTNRTVSWTITSFPGHTTDQVVTFKLKTNSNYTGTAAVNFTVAGRVLGPGTQTADSTLSQAYQYPTSPAPAATATPTPAPSKPTPTPTPTTAPTSPVIEHVTIPTITNAGSTITIQTTPSTTAQISYGTSPDVLTKTLTDPTQGTTHTVSLPNLSANTAYFFVITVSDPVSGKSTTSNIYTFKTAATPPEVSVVPDTLVVTSNDVVLLNSGEVKNNGADFLSVPVSTAFEIRLALAKYTGVKHLQAILRNETVLGVSTVDAETLSENVVDLTEIEPGIFTGRLKTPLVPGLYALLVKVQDKSGNLTEEKVATINVVSGLRVVSAQTGEGIEHAIVRIYLKDPNGHFILLTSRQFPLPSPLYSKPDGTVDVVLPEGTYKVAVTDIGYRDTSIVFTIGANDHESYPTIKLSPTGFNLLTYTTYYRILLSDTTTNLIHALQANATSTRLFDLIALIATVIAVGLTFYSLSVRMHMPLLVLPAYLLYRMKLFFRSHQHARMLHGIILETESHEPIQAAHIYLQDHTSGKVIGQTISNTFGEFRLPLPHGDGPYNITAVRRGYEQSDIVHVSDRRLSENIQLHMTHEEKVLEHIGHIIQKTWCELAGALFETILAISLVFELVFGSTLGWGLVMPFLLLTCFSLYLWITHRIELRRV